MKNIVIVALLACLACTGCATKKKTLLAPELAKKAMQAYEKKRYMQAVDTFEKLLDWYPFDKLATLAEFKIAEAHFEMKEYDEAVIYYKDFIKLHPRNEAIPYVMYQIAQAYYQRVDSVDRDQDNAKNAFYEFQNLIMKFPGSEYAKKAENEMVKCRENIAGHEIYVGEFYFKSKHYKAALTRFQGVLANYPGLGFDKEAKKHMALCKKEIARETSEKKK